MNLAHRFGRVRRVMEHTVRIRDVKAFVIERQTFAISDGKLAALSIDRKVMKVRAAAMNRFGENNIRDGAPMATALGRIGDEAAVVPLVEILSGSSSKK